MLALIVNPQLLEPYYPRPGDVLGNCVLALGLYFTATKATYPTGWRIFLSFWWCSSSSASFHSCSVQAGRMEGLLVLVERR